MAKYIHNTSGSEKVYKERPIPSGSFFLIPRNLEIEYSSDSTLIADVTAGTVAMSRDGVNDLSITNGLALLQASGDAEEVYLHNLSNSFSAIHVLAALEESRTFLLFGDGGDGDVSLSSGTTTLTRNMFYNNLTLSSTARINTAGFRIFVKNTLTMSGSSSISNDGANGNNASGNTAGTGSTETPGVTVGVGDAGGDGATQNNQAPIVGPSIGYGGSGGAGGAGGASRSGGAVVYRPERTVRQEHTYTAGFFKHGGNGGAGGSGGNNSLLATAAAGGSGGSGGGVVHVYAKFINNTSSVGITAIGGNGGNGGNAVSGNSGGGGGAGGGGGGFVYIISHSITNLGTLNVNGGTGGAGGNSAGTGTNGSNGTAGSTGHTAVYHGKLGTWTVT